MQKIVQEQWLPGDITAIWQFFATPNNLNRITPPEVSFAIQSQVPDKMYAGLLVHYTIKPFLNIPFNWITEITELQEEVYFIDEQRKGPYKTWRHEHHFRKVDNGVLMTDILHYDIGKGIVGWLAGIFFVHKRVRDIFAFRRKALQSIFSRHSSD